MQADRRRNYSASEAARALGISLDTLRRWDKQGRIKTRRDAGNRRIVSAREIERLRGEGDREGDVGDGRAMTRAFATLASTLTVFAAASLTDVLPRIDAHPHYSFAGSDTLALQIQQGAPADVFLAASTTQPSQLFQARLVYKPVVFATNELVLVVPRSNPAHIKSVLDIGRPGIKLVVAAT